MSLFTLLTMDPGPERDKLAEKLGYKMQGDKCKRINKELINSKKVDEIKAIRIKGDPENKDKSELEIEKEIVKYLFQNRIEHWKMKIKGELQSVGNNKYVLKQSENSGFPDILCCCRGKFVGVEIKKPGGLQSVKQISAERRIKSGGGHYFIVTSVAELHWNLRLFDLYPEQKVS